MIRWWRRRHDLAWFRVTVTTSVTRPVEATVAARSTADAMVMVGNRLRQQYGVDRLGETQTWNARRLPGNPGGPAGVVNWRETEEEP
jgi:hypothetical protein